MTSVSLVDISKRFGDNLANNRVSVHFESEAVHALLGENGAGKSTLMNMLYGLHRPDSGSILVDGIKVRIRNPRDAQLHGISMIHQHFALVDSMTVFENVLLSLPNLSFIPKRSSHIKRIAELSKRYELDVDPNDLVFKLPLSMQQRVEILKALYQDSQVLILDEPTSVLSAPEIESFLQIVRNLKSLGKTIILITHKLGEVMAVADHLTVMRKGEVVFDARKEETTVDEITTQMTGHRIEKRTVGAEVTCNQTVFEARKLNCRNDRGLPALTNVSLQIQEGEILGIAGVGGNGQTELAESIVGVRAFDSGNLFVDGNDMTASSVAQRRSIHHFGDVPSDRQGAALVMSRNLLFNAALRDFNRLGFVRFGILNHKKITLFAKSVVENYNVLPRNLNQTVSSFSGGNQQRFVFGRELHLKSDELRLLVVDQPCRGLDVGAVDFVHEKLLQQKRKKTATLYISTELSDLMSICDRIAVIFNGQILATLSREDFSTDRIGKLMAGLV